VLAVDERQSLEGVIREEKIATRTVVQLSEKEREFEERKNNRTEELVSQGEKKQEVEFSVLFHDIVTDLTTVGGEN
jgi:structural maintenance of chromosome 1